jgi:hypothetical protein
VTPSFPENPSRVLLAGDWHGNLAWAEHAVAHAGILGIGTIVHLGDFGFWSECLAWSEEYLALLTHTLDAYDVDLFWIDGNHENHSRLQSVPVDPDTGLRPITDRITHLPRGYRWQWAGVTWLALGGADSIDRHMRKEGVSWWPGETLSEDDITRAISGGPADVIVSHDAPDRVRIPGIDNSRSSWPLDAVARSQRHHESVGRVIDAVGATWLFHGHMHVKYRTWRVSESGHVTEVTGLDCDGTSMGRNLLSLKPADLDEPIVPESRFRANL